MGSKVSVVNQTPYSWYFASQDRGYTHICPGCTTSYNEALSVWRYIYFRYENDSWDSFSYEFNTNKGDTTFTLRETHDRSQFSLHCATERSVHYCANYGKIEEDRKRQQEEERRCQQQKIEEDRQRQQEEERRRQQRESIPSQCHVLSDEGIRGYYKAGYRNLVSEYSRLGILDQKQCERLDEWVNQDRHEDTNTAEYDQLLKALQC